MQDMHAQNSQPAAPEKQTQNVELPFLLITPKLVIRPLIGEDRAKMISAVRESIKDLKMWLPWSEEQPEEKDVERICNEFYADALKGIAHHMAIFRNEEFMGMCSYSDFDHTTMSTHIGYWCKSCYKDENYILDAVIAVMKYGFQVLGVREFTIPCTVGNYMSETTAKHLNFKLKTIDFMHGQQMKIMKNTALDSLPNLDVQWVLNPARPPQTTSAPSPPTENATAEPPREVDDEF